ncbi:hypothetical protein Nepgr_007620 [Nepenthes gracilis]|uniref:Uncharacterized protein n=1 Tax=Nepenthes gracilis TaxID=150966 RepID=A0AAD3S7C5_NEPGR|nr:hypothetical protein Nepgr_007620 [Nepenthes gracilis]
MILGVLGIVGSKAIVLRLSYSSEIWGRNRNQFTQVELVSAPNEKGKKVK